MVKLNKIYTRTGDDGTTGLVDGSRTQKFAPRMQSIGDVDELNAAIGMVVAQLGESPTAKALTLVQNELFDLGADLATPGDDFEPSDFVLRIIPAQVQRLEKAIDLLNEKLEPLGSFILPGGSEAAAATQLARAICRRAERAMVALSDGTSVNPAALAYINRLSDYLFTVARALNVQSGGDPLWVPGASRTA